MYIRQWLEQDLTKTQCFIVIDEELKRWRSYPEINGQFKLEVYQMFVDSTHSDELEPSMREALAISEASGRPIQNFGQTDSVLFEGVNNRLAITIFNNLAFVTRKEHYRVYGN